MKILRGLGSAAHGHEVDELDEETGVAGAVLAHGVDETAETRDEALVADAQERPARDVPDAGRLDDEHAGAAVGEACVPREHVLRHEAVLGRAPRHHRRYPRPLLGHCAATDRRRLEEPRAGGLLARRPASRRQRMLDAEALADGAHVTVATALLAARLAGGLAEMVVE